MNLKKILKKPERKKAMEKIDNFLTKEMFIPAIIMAQENKLIDKEIECHEKYYETFGQVYWNATKRMSDLGLLKNAIKFLIREDYNANSETLKKIKHDLLTNESAKIFEYYVLLNPETKNQFFEEIYYFKETNDSSKIKERIEKANPDNNIFIYVPDYIKN